MWKLIKDHRVGNCVSNRQNFIFKKKCDWTKKFPRLSRLVGVKNFVESAS